MDKEAFRSCVRAILEKHPVDAPPMTTGRLADLYRAQWPHVRMPDLFRALDGCKDMSYTEPELKTRGPNKGKIVNARRWCHPSRLPAREPNTIDELRAKLRELEQRIAVLEARP